MCHLITSTDFNQVFELLNCTRQPRLIVFLVFAYWNNIPPIANNTSNVGLESGIELDRCSENHKGKKVHSRLDWNNRLCFLLSTELLQIWYKFKWCWFLQTLGMHLTVCICWVLCSSPQNEVSPLLKWLYTKELVLFLWTGDSVKVSYICINDLSHIISIIWLHHLPSICPFLIYSTSAIFQRPLCGRA